MSHPESLSPLIAYVWQKLGALPGDQYVLIGGTALSYQIGHRISYDIDLATHKSCHHPRVIRAALNVPELGPWPENPLLDDLAELVATHKPATITFASPYIEGPGIIPTMTNQAQPDTDVKINPKQSDKEPDQSMKTSTWK